MTKGVKLKNKLIVWERDGWECRYCSCAVVRVGPEQPESAPNTATVDHVIPHSAGGSKSPGNLVTCCYSCNQAKGNVLLPGFKPSVIPTPTLADVWPDLNQNERDLFRGETNPA